MTWVAAARRRWSVGDGSLKYRLTLFTVVISWVFF
jgi:hypothetical protein